MSDASAKSPLESQDWAGAMGERWLGHLAQFEGMIAPVGSALIAKARLTPGESVVDVGCGAGPTTLEIAARVSPGGLALGLDLSPVLVDAAVRRASKSARHPGAARAVFRVADAAVDTPAEAPFDVLFSRFGVMFFDDPYPAFANMAGWLKPGGRAAIACWAPPSENPWVGEIQTITERYVETPPPNPHAPGPFALADAERLRDILEKAGLADVAIEAWSGDLPFAGPGATPASAADFALNGMHIGQLVEDEPQEVKDSIRRDIEAAFASHVRDGSVLLPATSWFVTARRAAADA